MSDNELIAEFMGFPVEYESVKFTGGFETKKRKLQYDTSWDWLMPVVEKIDVLYSDAFPSGPEFVKRVLAKEKLDDIIDSHYTDVVAIPITTPINEVYTAIVEFIKWYNENKKQS